MTSDITISTDSELLDRDRIYRWLSEESYWALGRERSVQDAAMASSLNFGAYAAGEQVGYARVITDYATFAWVADVFVDPAARGRGVGVRLVEAVMAVLEPLDLVRIGLVTADAHSLYERFGFTSLDNPERSMARLRSAR